jgi:P pilus assembly chaperone PapD
MVDRFFATTGSGRSLLFAALSYLLLMRAASADMVLSDIIVDLQAPEEMRYDIEVWNSGEEPMFVEIDVSQVLDPAGDESLRETLVDPRTAGLLASPKRLVIAPDERKRVRLVARKMPTDADLVYRVAFVPKENTTTTTKPLAFKVLVGYEVLVLIRPPKARPDLVVTRTGKQMHFDNQGHSSVLLRMLESCPSEEVQASNGEAACEELPGNRLYAGEEWDVELPQDGPVRVFESYRNENRVSEY